MIDGVMRDTELRASVSESEAGRFVEAEELFFTIWCKGCGVITGGLDETGKGVMGVIGLNNSLSIHVGTHLCHLPFDGAKKAVAGVQVSRIRSVRLLSTDGRVVPR